MFAQTIDFRIDVVDILGMSDDIMMAPISFEVKPFELINLFCFDFVVLVFFDLINERLTSFYI